MKTNFLIAVDGKVTKLDWTKPNLEQLQKAVGGYVEHVQLDGRTELWVNEEGKLNDLPFNHIATRVWETAYGQTDMIVGPAIVSFSGKPTKQFEHQFKLLEELAA